MYLKTENVVQSELRSARQDTMEKIAIIGASDFQNPLILKAKELGYETHVFAWECGDIGEKTADYFYPISIREKEQILNECREIGPDGICSIGSDLAVSTVNYVARELGLTANSEKSDRVSTDKFEMRKALEKAGIRTPKYIKVTDLDEDILHQIRSFSFPIVVKPTDRSGSRAVTKLESEEGLKEAVEAAVEQSFDHAAIVEEFVEGKEYSCECISYAGKHQMLAVTEKFTTGAPHYIEIGHIEPAPISEQQREQIEEEVYRALDALDIQYGASHPEIRIDDNGRITIIEVGARMGGDCIGADLVRLSTGNDYVKMVIDVACGKEPGHPIYNNNVFAAVRFLVNDKDMDLIEIANKNFHVVWVSDIDADRRHIVADSSSRYGYILITDLNYLNLRRQLFGQDIDKN